MLGGGKEGLRRGAFEDFAFGDEGDAVGYGSGESHIMGAEDDVLSGADEFADQLQHFHGHLGVEGGGGLVEEEQLRLCHDCADEGDPLLLPATELDVETNSGEKNEMGRQQ